MSHKVLASGPVVSADVRPFRHVLVSRPATVDTSAEFAVLEQSFFPDELEWWENVEFFRFTDGISRREAFVKAWDCYIKRGRNVQD